MCQIEEAPGTARPHIQGYVEFTKQTSMAEAKLLLGDQAIHLEVRRGTREQAMEYCQKDETRREGPWILGDPSHTQGTRSDLIAVKRALDSGASNEAIADQFFGSWVRYRRSFDEYRALKKMKVEVRDSTVDPTVFVLWGSTGTGKTKAATDAFPDAYWLMKPVDRSTVWMDGYTGQSTVIIDEFYGWLPFDLLLRMLDRYPLQMQIKGGVVQLLATTFVITSNKSPDTWYPRVLDVSPLLRRLNVIWEFDQNGIYTHKFNV